MNIEIVINTDHNCIIQMILEKKKINSIHKKCVNKTCTRYIVIYNQGLCNEIFKKYDLYFKKSSEIVCPEKLLHISLL